MLWAMNSYFAFGDFGKYLSLLLGFLMVLYSSIKMKSFRGISVFFMASTILCILYIMQAFYLKQNTLNPGNIIFFIVSYILLNSGYLIGRGYKFKYDYLNNRYIYPITILLIVGCIAFLKEQNMLALEKVDSRNIGFGDSVDTDNYINPIGVAYIHASILIVIYVFYKYYYQKGIIEGLLLIFSGILSLAVLVSTLSRGALMYLIIMYLLHFIGRGFNSSLNISKLVKYIIGFILIVAIIYIFVAGMPVIQEKISNFVIRYESMYLFFLGSGIDLSAEERSKYYSYFFQNIMEFMFMGMREYQPYPHNQYMEIIMRWGLFGMPVLIFSIYVFIKAIKISMYKKYLNVRKMPLVVLVLYLFLFSYFQSFTSMSLEMNRFMWFGFGFIFGLNIDNDEYNVIQVKS